MINEQQCPESESDPVRRPAQRSTTLHVPELEAQPIWNVPALQAIATPFVEQIREEFFTVVAKARETKDTSLAERSISVSVSHGHWGQYYLMEEGIWNEQLRALVPNTLKLLDALPICESSVGFVYFSVLEPGTVIQPHHGPTNVKLRCQLPVLLEDQCRASISVGDETRLYEQGRLLVFDDTFEHSVRHISGGKRVVLLFDIWHPQVSPCASIFPGGKSAVLGLLPRLRKLFKPEREPLQASSHPVDHVANLDSVPHGVLLRILGKLPADVLVNNVFPISKRWYDLGRLDEVWRAVFVAKWNSAGSSGEPPSALPAAPDGSVMRSWREAYFNEFDSKFQRRSFDSGEQTRWEVDFLFKLLMIGDPGVGKSCFCLRFTDETFTESYISTIGVDFRIKTVGFENKLIKLQIWDTAGPERFRTITSAYYRGCHGILVMFDVQDRRSFESVPHWMDQISANANQACKRILVGCKADNASDRREVAASEGRSCAERFCCRYIECSAKTGFNVERAVCKLVQEVYPSVQASAVQALAGRNFVVQSPAAKKKCDIM
jgi:Ras-related protein Rab-1A